MYLSFINEVIAEYSQRIHSIPLVFVISSEIYDWVLENYDRKSLFHFCTFVAPLQDDLCHTSFYICVKSCYITTTTL